MHFRISSQNRCFISASTGRGPKIVDNVDKSVDNYKSGEFCRRSLWIRFVDNVENFFSQLSKIRNHLVELCNLYKM